MIRLYENTVILIKWIDMKINKKVPTVIIPPSKKDKNSLCEVRFACLLNK